MCFRLILLCFTVITVIIVPVSVVDYPAKVILELMVNHSAHYAFLLFFFELLAQ